jgi:hypothetical protein
MKAARLTILAFGPLLAAAIVGPAAAATQPASRLAGPGPLEGESPVTVGVDAPACACDTGYDITVEYSSTSFPVDGVLELYEDDALVHTVPLSAFQGSATEVFSVTSGTEGAHTWRAVLNVSGGGDSMRVEAIDTTEICETPRLAGVPDQTFPFHSFHLRDYLTYGGDRPLRFDVGGPLPPPPGWEISINYDGTITVYAPEGTPYSMELTFHAWVECSPGVFCVTGDTAVFGPSPLPAVCPTDAAIELERRVNGEDADAPPGPEIPVGARLTWTYQVTNSGRVPLDHVIVADDRMATICTFANLAPGETRTCETTGTAGEGAHVYRAKAAGLCVAEGGTRYSVRDIDLAHYLGVLR